LADARVHSNRWEIAFAEKFVKLSSTQSALDEDDDLVEFEAVEEVIEFAILLRLVKLDAVLLETVQSELGLIINVHLERISHEFLANRSDCLRQSGAEHHDLLLGWGLSEDFLNVAAHI
jgi:hypothetical protein